MGRKFPENRRVKCLKSKYQLRWEMLGNWTKIRWLCHNQFMVIESESEEKKYHPNWGGVRANQNGRAPVFPDTPTTRKQIVLPDEWWDSLKEKYPESSYAMIIYRVLDDHSILPFD